MWSILPWYFIMKNFKHPVSWPISPVNTYIPHLVSAINIFTALSIIGHLCICVIYHLSEFTYPLPTYLCHIYLHSCNISNIKLHIAYRVYSMKITPYYNTAHICSSQTICGLPPHFLYDDFQWLHRFPSLVKSNPFTFFPYGHSFLGPMTIAFL